MNKRSKHENTLPCLVCGSSNKELIDLETRKLFCSYTCYFKYVDAVCPITVNEQDYARKIEIGLLFQSKKSNKQK